VEVAVVPGAIIGGDMGEGVATMVER